MGKGRLAVAKMAQSELRKKGSEALRSRTSRIAAAQSAMAPISCNELSERIPGALQFLELPFLHEMAIGEHEHAVELAREFRA